MSKNLMGKNTQGSLIFSQGDSPASHTALPANKQDQTMTGLSGQKCLESLEKFNRDGFWAKTFPAYLLKATGFHSSKCLLNWKIKVIKCNRLLFQLAVSMRPISGTGYGLLPTITASEGGQNGTSPTVLEGNEKGKKHGINLEGYVKTQLLPTPMVSGQEGYETRVARKGHETAMNYLESAVDYLTSPKLLPTPTSGADRNTNYARGGTCLKNGLLNQGLIPTPRESEWKGVGPLGSKSHQHHLDRSYLDATVQEATGKTGQLNHHFVMEMMGFPPDWCDLPMEQIADLMKRPSKAAKGKKPSKEEETQ